MAYYERQNFNGRGIPGIPRGRGGFGRGGQGRGGLGMEQAAVGGNRGRGRGDPSPRGGYGQPNGLPQGGSDGGSIGPPVPTQQIAAPAPLEGQQQPTGSRARRTERRKEKKKLKGKQKEEAPVDPGGGGDDEIIEVDFNDMARVFGPAPGAASNPTVTVPAPVYVPPPQSPVRAQVSNTNRGGPVRGRGRGRGGRGGFNPTPQPGQAGHLAQGGKKGGYNHTDFDLQQYAYPSQPQASGSKISPKGVGPIPKPKRGRNSQPQFPFQAGAGGRRNRANFRGFTYDDDDDPTGQALRKIARKGLGESNNIYLRPIKFVKSSAILFQDQEEIFAAEVADNDSTNPNGAVPTANRVEQVFHGGVKSGSGLAEEEDQQSSPDSESGSENNSKDESPKEMDKSVAVREEVKTPPPRLEVTTLVEATARLEVAQAPEDDGDDIILFTPIRRKGSIAAHAEQPTAAISVQERIQETEIVVAKETAQVEVSQTEVTTEITMDVEPEAGPSTSSQRPPPDTTSDELIANLLQVEEDSKLASTNTQESKMLQTLTGRKRAPKQQRGGGGKRARQAEKGKGKRKGKGKEKEKINWNARPLFRNEDINWSTASSEAEGGGEEDDDMLGGMDVDPDLAGPSHDKQYAAFVESVLRSTQENQVSAADLEAEAAMEEDGSDEEAQTSMKEMDVRPSVPSGKKGEMDQVINVIEGDDDGDDAWTDTSDSDESGGEEKTVAAEMVIDGGEEDIDEEEDDEEDEEEDEDELFQEFALDEDGESDLAMAIQTFLDDNAEILQGGRRMKKERRKLFQSLREMVPDDELIHAAMDKKRNKKKTPNWLPPDLADQWEKDRQKKAENKRKRAEALREAMAAEPPGKKRSKKLKIRLEAMEEDSDLDSDLEFELADGQPKTKSKKGKGKDKKKAKEPAKPKFDVWKIGRQIQGFVSDRNRDSLQLPPMDKDSRRRVHEIAVIYKLGSQSSGKGDARAITLRHTGKTTQNVNEKKLEARLRNWEDALLGGGKGRGGGKAGDPKGSGRHREGDIVGQHAAKIGSGNVGYQMLQMMGWSEGDRMGVTGGLEAPIHAVFKATKLGLGSI